MGPSQRAERESRVATTNVLLHVFLAVLEGGLANLGGNLGRRIVHELSVGAKDVAGRGALLLVGRAAAIALLLRLRRAWRRRRRAELGDRRDVLRHRVVQRGRLPVRRPLHGARGYERRGRVRRSKEAE